MPRDEKVHSVHFPTDIHDLISKKAKGQGRSVSGQVVWTCKLWMFLEANENMKEVIQYCEDFFRDNDKDFIEILDGLKKEDSKKTLKLVAESRSKYKTERGAS